MHKKGIRFDGILYLPSKTLAARVHLVPDYVTRLARTGAVRGIRQNGIWYIDPENLQKYLQEHDARKREVNERTAIARRAERYEARQIALDARAGQLPVLTLPHPFFRRAARRRAAFGTAIRTGAVTVASFMLLLAGSHALSPLSSSNVAAAASTTRNPLGSLAVTIFHTLCPLFSSCRQTTAPVITFVPMPMTAASSSPAHAEPDPRPIQKIINQPVVERVIERLQPVPAPVSPVTLQDLSALESRVDARIAALSLPVSFPQSIGAAGVPILMNSAAPAAQRIDQLNGVTITNPHIIGGDISGTAGITAALPDDASFVLATITDATTTSLFSSSASFDSLAATNATTTNLFAQDLLLGSALAVRSGGTGTSTAPVYGQVLLGNATGGYDLVATSSLGIIGGGGGSWGSITGTLSSQTDLQSALDAKVSLTDWYATTTDQLKEGSSNLYFTPARALAQFITNLSATTSVASITTLPNLSLPSSQVAGIFGYLFPDNATTTGLGIYASTTIGNGTQAGGLIVSGGATTTGNIAFTGLGSAGLLYANASGAVSSVSTSTWSFASSTLLADSNTFSGANVFNGLLSTGSTTVSDGIASLHVSASGGSTLGWNGYQLFLGGNSFLTLAGANPYIESADENGLLELRSHGATGGVSFTTDGTERFRVAGSGHVGVGTSSPIATFSVAGNTFLGGNLTATGTIALTALGSGFVGASNGTLYTFASSSLTAASSTLLADSNTFSGTNTFVNTISGSVTGNAGTVTNGVYTTTFNGLFDPRFVTDLSATTSVASITSLPNLSLPSSQVAGIFGYLFPNNATTTGLGIYASSTIGNGTASGGLTVNGNATTTGLLNVLGSGTSTIASNIGISGSITPSADNTYSLGSSLSRWRDLFVGPGSIYVNNQEVLHTDPSQNIVVGADPNQSLLFQTSGTGDIQLNPTGTGVVYLKSNILVSGGKTVNTSDNSALVFTDGLAGGNLQIAANAITATNTNGGISLSPNGSGGVYVTNGSFGIGTTSPFAKLSVAGSGFFDGNLTSANVVASGTLNVSGLSTLGNASTSILSSSYASSTNLFAGSLTLGSLAGVLRASGGAVSTGLVNLASEVSGILGIANGGTGTSTAPTYGKLLVGNAAGSYDLVATSSLGITSGITGTQGYAITFDGSGGQTATSSLFFASNGIIGVGSTTPWAQLAVNAPAGVNSFVIGSSTATDFIVDRNGSVGIGTTSPGSLFAIQDIANFQSGTSTLYQNLNVQGALTVGAGAIYLNGTATSSFARGIDIQSGCFSILGTCVLSSGSSGLTAGDLNSAVNNFVNAMQIASTTGKYVYLSDGMADSFGSYSTANLSGIDQVNSANLATGTNGSIGGLAADAASTLIFLTATGANSWAVPSDWNSNSNTIEVIGGGGGGGGANNGQGGGGGGGAYSAVSNLALTSGANVSYTVGAGGSGGTSGDGTDGGDTWFNGASFGASSVAARGGIHGTRGSPGSGGAGGSASTGIGTTKHNGGAGANGASASYGGGGGGAGGSRGDGGDASASNGGAGDAGFGGAGGIGNTTTQNGSKGTEWDASHGSGGGGGGITANTTSTGGAGGNYGAGGGGPRSSGTPAAGAGSQGIIAISYNALNPYGDIRLLSNSFSASSSPAAARFLFAAAATSSFTPNVDVEAAVSRDNGSHWATTTLALLATLEDGSKLLGDTAVDLSSQPSGTSMRYRIYTHHSKAISIYGVALEWGAVAAQNAGSLSVTGALSASALSLTSALGVPYGGTGWSNFTAGSLLFGNGSSALATSSALFWDNTNSFLGIATTSPSGKLSIDLSGINDQVIFGLSAGNYLSIKNNGAGGSPRFESGNNIIFRFSTTTGSTAGASAGNQSLFLMDANGTTNVLLAATGTVNSYLAANGGNVGIGTTSPTANLHVNPQSGDAVLKLETANNSNFANIQLAGGPSSSTWTIGTQQSYLSNGLVFRPGGSGTEKMIISTAGFVGIGANPQAHLHIAGDDTSNWANAGIYLQDTGANGRNFSISSRSDSGAGLFEIGDETAHVGRLFIDGSGNVGIGTSNMSTPNPGVVLNPFGVVRVGNNAGATGFGFVVFTRSATQIGSITQNGTTAVVYNTTSDRRVKENIATTTLGIDQLMQLPVRQFDFISDPTHATTTGFIAQELEPIFPWAVTTNGDNGLVPLGASSTPWSVDYGRVTPLIVKAVQDVANITGVFRDNLIAWLGDAGNGIDKLFAKEIHAQNVFADEVDAGKLCAKKSDGSYACVTGDQLALLLAGAAAPAATPASGTQASSTPAALAINGNNPAQWQRGTPWQDNLGALFTHDGTSETIYSTSTIDTTVVGTSTIDYWATYYADPTATSSAQILHATRQVVVIAPLSSTSSTSSYDTASTATSTTP